MKSNSLSSIINQYKGAVKRYCNKNGHEDFKWQSKFYDHVIRNDESLFSIRKYIKNNIKKHKEGYLYEEFFDLQSPLYPMIVREHVIKAIRQFFDTQEFHEIQVPVLNKTIPLEPTLYSFKTCWNSKENMDLFLSTSPEGALKKLISKGIGNCYAIGSSFRNLEDSGRRHNPEFLMLEWYRVDADYNDIIEDCKKLIEFVESFLVDNKIEFNNIDFSDGYWEEYTKESLFRKYIGRGWLSLLSDTQMHEFCKTKGLNVENANWEQLFNQLFLNYIEPHLIDEIPPVIIKDFPAKISPLCKRSAEDPNIAERFEFYINGMEIGNGNSEQLDAN